MPLCWAHAEYLTLVRSRYDGVGFDFIPPIYERYVTKPVESKVEVWTRVHQSPRMAAGKTLRLITERPATVHWSADGWCRAQDQPTKACKLGLWYADLPTDKMPAGGTIVFTLHWEDRWEGKDFEVRIG